MKDKIVFGKFIKSKRIEKNYSQKELADLLYVTDSAVSKWERGVAYPDITLITDICRVLDITEHELIQSTNDTELQKMKTDARKYNKIKKILLWIFNISYLITILTCLIVNISVNHTLSWFYIVLASLMVGYSFCPTITWLISKFKKLMFIGSTYLSLFILYLTISIYTNNYWFMIATMGTLLGYFIVFYPIVFKRQKLYLKDDYQKLSKWFFLSYVSGILIILSLLYLFINLYIPINLGMTFLITYCISVIFILIGLLLLLRKGKKIMWVFIIILSGILVLLILLSLFNAIYLNSTKETKTYQIVEPINNIIIDLTNYDVKIKMSDTNDNKIIYDENKKLKLDLNVVDDKLVVKEVDHRKFYEKMINITKLDLTLSLTKSTIDLLQVNSETSDIDVEGNFNNIIINNSTGDIKIKANVNKDITIKNSTGDIKIDQSTTNGNVKIETSTGDIKLVNTTCNKLDIDISTGDTVLKNVIVRGDFNVVGETGDVLFIDFDAVNINIDVSTGDVKGTILTHKFFIAKSSTGIVRVPETRDGGECRITTSTGDIKVSYKE